MRGRLTVGEVAAVTGVTVRTLHHYDRIGSLARQQIGRDLYDCPPEVHARPRAT